MTYSAPFAKSNPWPPAVDVSTPLGKAFLTAMLLSGSPSRAEAAVVEALRAMPYAEAAGQTLLRESVSAVLRGSMKPGPAVGEKEEGAHLLPPALQPVLRLPTAARQSFVLRILSAWPAEVCANLLHMDVHSVNENAGLAARALACIGSKEQPE